LEWVDERASRGRQFPERVVAAFHGKPAFFSLIGAWTKPERMTNAEKKTIGQRVNKIVGLLLLCSLLAAAVLLARRNYRQGRADRAGAFRLAVVMFALEMGCGCAVPIL
jgi:hypothetical protein